MLTQRYIAVLNGRTDERAELNARAEPAAPIPFAGLPVVAGDAALDHFVAPMVACDNEAREVAAAEAKRTERHDDDELQ